MDEIFTISLFLLIIASTMPFAYYYLFKPEVEPAEEQALTTEEQTLTTEPVEEVAPVEQTLVTEIKETNINVDLDIPVYVGLGVTLTIGLILTARKVSLSRTSRKLNKFKYLFKFDSSIPEVISLQDRMMRLLEEGDMQAFFKLETEYFNELESMKRYADLEYMGQTDALLPLKRSIEGAVVTKSQQLHTLVHSLAKEEEFILTQSIELGKD